MIRTFAVAAIVLLALSSSTFAAKTYYVVQNSKTHKCSVTSTMPTGAIKVMVGTGTFKTKALAKADMKAEKACMGM
jgi:hypothetical protein